MYSATPFTIMQKKIGYLTLLFFALFYFTTSSGINCSNDGSHFALASAIYYHHSPEIKPFFHYVQKSDYAVKDGIIYSDRLPGNAFLMLPFLAYSNLLKLAGNNYLGKRFEADVVAISFLPNICGLIGLVLLFFLYRKIGFDFNLAYISTVIYGIATLHWLESVHAFSHGPSMMFVLWAVYLTVSVKDLKKDQKLLYAIAVLIGFSTIIELQNILFLFPIFLYTIVLIHPSDFLRFRSWVPVVSGCMAIAAFFLACLAFYNYLTFGEILLKSNTYNPHFPEEKSFGSALDGNLLLGLDKLLTNFANPIVYTNWRMGVGNDTPGIFITSPVLFLSLFGYVTFFKKQKNIAILFLLMIAISIAIAALHKTTLTRHIFTITPLLYFPMIYSLHYLLNSGKVRVAGTSLAAMLVLLSTARVAYVIYSYYGRAYLGLFRYHSEMLFFLMFYIPLITIVLLRTRKKMMRDDILKNPQIS